MTEYSDKEIAIRNAVIKFMKTKPFYRLKVAPLMKELGFSRTVFYEYYGSIYDVIEQIEADIFPKSKQILVGDVSNREAAQLKVEKSIMNLVKYKEEFKAITGPNGDPSFTHKYIRRIQKFTTALAESVGCSAEESAMIGYFSASGYVSTLVALVNTKYFNEDTARKYCFYIINQGFNNIKGYENFLKL